jgi:NAD+ kinase
MKAKFQTVGIIAKRHITGLSDTLLTLINLLKSKKLNVILETDTAELLSIKHGLPTLPHENLGKKCDLLIVIGGDGCMLSAAHTAAINNTPIIGINRGRLGFLTDIKPNEIDLKINSILQGNYREENRFLLQTKLDDSASKQQLALNEVVLTAGESSHMIEFEIYINNDFMFSHRADGVIISTPTGSTAYSLSGGGPILHPNLDAIVMVPMFPHTLTSRPIVVDANQKIKITIAKNNKIPAYFSCDGKNYISVKPGKSFVIQKFTNPLKLIHPKEYNYFETLRSKLYWGQKLPDNE